MEKESRKSMSRYICNSVILAGLIILFTGLYYVVIKAGIPYQDPPLELQIQYAVNMGIGEILTKTGAFLTFGSIIARIFLIKSNKNR